MILGLVLCGLFQPQMAGWERTVLLWEGQCVLLTEAFIALAAGASGGGELLLCGVGLVTLHLSAMAGFNCGLEFAETWVSFSLPALLVSTCRVCATETQETPRKISTTRLFYFTV